ncbi:unnamed protein product, partial [Ectocarpus sp. 12 AP-2014]
PTPSLRTKRSHEKILLVSFVVILAHVRQFLFFKDHQSASSCMFPYSSRRPPSADFYIPPLFFLPPRDDGQSVSAFPHSFSRPSASQPVLLRFLFFSRRPSAVLGGDHS